MLTSSIFSSDVLVVLLDHLLSLHPKLMENICSTVGPQRGKPTV